MSCEFNMKKAHTGVQTEPLFVYSVGKGWFLSIPFVGFFATVGTYSLIQYKVVSGVFLLAIAVLTAPWLIVRYATPRTRKVIFYENSMTFLGRDQKGDVVYSQIAKVDFVKSNLLGPRTEIYLAGESKPLVMIKNPANKELGLDLLTWL